VVFGVGVRPPTPHPQTPNPQSPIPKILIISFFQKLILFF